MNRAMPIAAALVAGALAAFSPAASANGPVEDPLIALRLSTDVAVEVGTQSTMLAEDDALIDWTAADGAAVVLDFANENPAAGLDAYHDLGGGFHLLSYDVAVRLRDGSIAHPADVIREGPPPDRSQDIVFRHDEFLISDSANVDAVLLVPPNLFLSFDTDTVVNAGTADELVAGDEDVVGRDITVPGPLQLFFPGSAVGIPEGVGIDALGAIDTGGVELLLVSFDVSGTLPNGGAPIAFADEDVLGFDSSETWRMVWDGSVELPGIESADVDAIAGAALAARTPTVTATASVTATVTATGTALPTSTATVTAPPTATATATVPAAATATATGTTAPSTATATETAADATATATVPVGATATETPGGSTCVGDCDGSGEVSISELILGVNIALGNAQVAECPSFDPNGDGMVAINELIQAVGNALGRCA